MSTGRQMGRDEQWRRVDTVQTNSSASDLQQHEVADEKIAAVILAHNIESRIHDLVLKVGEHVHETVVVDNGSTDETRQAARAAGAAVLSHACRLERSRALSAGIDEAMHLGATIVLTLDAVATDDVDVTLVIPAYNEEEALPRVLSELMDVVDDRYEVIVVDDGSDDATYAVATTFGLNCTVLRHAENCGKGAAMQTGLRNARGRKVIFIDGDATYPVDTIPEIASLLDDYDIVRATRSHGREFIPLVNRMGNILFDLAIRFLHRVDGVDTLSGLYGVRAEALERMRLESTGFDIESEIVIKANAMQLRSHSIPIGYGERVGNKKLNPVRDGLDILTRVLTLASMFNPFMMYVVPGFILWLAATVMLLAVGRGPLFTPIGGLTTHTFIFAIMSFLTGFQLIVLGLVVNLYAAETGLRPPSRSLELIARAVPRLGGAVVSVVMIGVGIGWSAFLALKWGLYQFGPFNDTELLVLALSLVVWGFQLLCMMFFLSLFAGAMQQPVYTKNRIVPAE